MSTQPRQTRHRTQQQQGSPGHRSTHGADDTSSATFATGVHAAAIPFSEPERLQALHASRLLLSAPSPACRELTAAAALLFRVPVVLVSLIDKDRQVFYCALGSDLPGTHRDDSFCAHALLAERLLVVPDTLQDPRFRSNPLVVGAPGIRFYAGAPVCCSGGNRLGTLCLIDSRPRTAFGPRSHKLLESFARVMSMVLATEQAESMRR